MSAPLGEHRWPELASTPPVIAVPVGSLEQHGPHLPLDTDTRVAVAVAERAAAQLGSVAVAPAVAYGASGEHQGFPGTLSIGSEALATLLVELGRSADRFAGVVFVNGHGGNLDALRAAVATLHGEGRRCVTWSARLTGDAHAGQTETSLLLAIAPHLVALHDAVAGATEPLPELLPSLRAHGVAAVSPSGVLGDPRGASADAGQQLLAALVADLVATIERFCNAGGDEPPS